jgi:hypothetical protein
MPVTADRRCMPWRSLMGVTPVIGSRRPATVDDAPELG